jgi:hypothetical protein
VYGERDVLEGVGPWWDIDELDIGPRKGVGEYVSRDEDPESCESCLSEREEQEMVAVVDVKEKDDAGRICLVEGPRIEAQIRLACGMEVAVINTAAYNVWVDEATFFAAHGYELCRGSVGAKRVNGSPLAALGAGRIDFELSGKLFAGVTVRVMKKIPSRMLLGRRFLLNHKIVLDLGAGHGSFSIGISCTVGRLWLGAMRLLPRTEFAKYLRM